MNIAEKIRDSLRNVLDPEVNQNIVELGLIKNITGDGVKAVIELTPTSAFCPVGRPDSVERQERG